MAASKKDNEDTLHIPARPAATNPDDREKQLISYAYDLAEEQLLNKTASSQIVAHLLKAGSARERLEHQKLLKDLEMADAKIKQLEQADRLEGLLSDAIEAMRGYAPGRELPDFHVEISETDYDGG